MAKTKTIRVFIRPDDYEATFDVESGRLLEVLVFPDGRSSYIQQIPVAQLSPNIFNELRHKYHNSSKRE